MVATSPADVVISVDAHVGEPDALRARLPKRYRERLPRFGIDENGDFDIRIEGGKRMFDKERHSRTPTAEDMLKEFRTDPSQGTDLDRRLHDMALEGIDAQVIFPNIGLSCSMGTQSAGYYHAWARAYNDFVWDTFSAHHDRFRPAAMLAVDDPKRMVAEAERTLKLGFASLFLPATVPWQPYRMTTYDPLWALAAEAGVPVNFHIFSGNMALRGDFASVADLSPGRVEKARQVVRDEEAAGQQELVGISVLGLASGMSPIVELCGSGVLERHPDLKFVIVESECGWLAWALHCMDQMQERRYLGMFDLPLRPSEYFRRQGAISITDDPVALNNVGFTGTDCLIWGNDYPHDEGTFPNSRPAIEAIRDALPAEQARAVLAGNAARVYGFDLDRLATTRAEVTRHLH